MVNPVIMQLKIELSEAQKDFNECEIKIKRLFYELSSLLNPYYKTIEEIKAEEIEQSADELLKIKTEAKAIQAKINDIKTQLGE